MADKIAVGENLRMAVIVGFLGAFTTFSTFEMEIYGLMKERFFATASRICF
jgi:fluoride ion exporter CrcB/FEX